MIREAIESYYRQKYYTPWVEEAERRDNRELAHRSFLSWTSHNLECNPTRLQLLGLLTRYNSSALRVRVGNQVYANALGVAAGLDKNGDILKTLQASGFGHVEIGSFTLREYGGNDEPRIFDLPEDDGLINRMGYPGHGVEGFNRILVPKLTPRGRFFKRPVVHVNVAASRPSFNEGTHLDDYLKMFEIAASQPNVDAITINISSPNTPGVRAMQEPEVIRELLSRVDKIAFTRKNGKTLDKSVLVKIAPDLTKDQIDSVLDEVLKHSVQGIIVTNTTTSAEVRSKLKSKHKDEVGGISGAPLTDLALEVSRHVFQQVGRRLHLIRAGGVMSSLDYWNAISFGGADLVQCYTALIKPKTTSPFFAYHMNRDLAKMMKERLVRNIAELKGQEIVSPVIWWPTYFGKTD